MHKLIDRAGIALEVPDELLVLPAPLERRKAEFLVELHRLGHRADAERVGSQLVERHWKFLLARISPSDRQRSPTRPRDAKHLPYRHAPRPHPCPARRDDTGRRKPRPGSWRCNGHAPGHLLAAPSRSRTGRNLGQSGSENRPGYGYTPCRAG